jgi:hypothetical protein
MAASDPQIRPPGGFLKQALILWAGGVIGGVAVLPYAFHLQAKVIAETSEKSGLSLWGLGLISGIQTAVFLFLIVCAGLFFARRVGLTAPVSQALAEGRPAWPVLKRDARLAVLLGAGTGLFITAIELVIFLPRLPAAFQEAAEALYTPEIIWQGALASLYGGISEEILTRLFLLSLFALLLRALFRLVGASPGADTPPSTAILWSANVLAAILFGLGHLPAAANLAPLTPLILVRTLALNFPIALCCGWLFFRRGLESGPLNLRAPAHPSTPPRLARAPGRLGA